MSKNSLISFSGILQKNVISDWKKACMKGNYEECCHWGMEMLISGWVMVWWEQVIQLVSKNFHVHNPQIGLFLWKIKCDNKEIFLSNNRDSQELKEVITFVNGVICFSPKGVTYPIPSLQTRKEEIDHVLNKLQQTKIHHIVKMHTRQDDSIILQSLLSVFVGHLENKDLNSILRIIGWILFLEKSKLYKKYIKSDERPWKTLNLKDQCDWTLFLFEILVEYSTTISAPKYEEIIKGWRSIYLDNFERSKRSSKFHIIITCIMLLSQQQYLTPPCIYNSEIIDRARSNIDVIYKNILIKKQENVALSYIGSF